MREIKSRAWDSLHNRMLYTSWENFDWWYKDEDCLVIAIQRGCPDEEYLSEPMQYIDQKDKDGTEIYEGDILGGGIAAPFVVEWEAPWFGFKIDKTNIPLTEGSLKVYRVKVIGNIFEHKELLDA